MLYRLSAVAQIDPRIDARLGGEGSFEPFAHARARSEIGE
jgi:hypothetical protein